MLSSGKRGVKLIARAGLGYADGLAGDVAPPAAARRLLDQAEALGDLGDGCVELGFEAVHLALALLRRR